MFAKGDNRALRHVVDIFKKVAPGTLWRDDLVPNWVRWQWPKLEPGTIVPNISVQEAQTAALSGPASSTVTGAGAASSGATGSEMQATAAAAPATANAPS